MRNLIAVLISLSFCAVSLGDKYIVLFTQQEIGISSLGHGGYQNVLQSANEKDVKQLQDWAGKRNIRSEISDIWLVRGASLDLNAAQVAQLAKEPWVKRILKDKTRQFINPIGRYREVEEPPKDLWGLKDMGLQKIRETYPDLNGEGIRVGILDTGIQSRHPEFRHPERGFIPVKFKDFLSHIKYPYDDHGHGTHVAGTIAGTNVGIAPNVSLVVGKVFTAGGSGSDSSILEAMQWVFDPDGDPATDDYAQLVNNSWGAALAGPGPFDIAEFEAYRRAVQTWVNGGVFPIFAAGNSGGVPNGVPGGLPESLAVGATQSDGAIAGFSSRGPNLWKMDGWVLSLLKPDISAPGLDIPSALPGNKYGTWSGTSMATPHVSGAVALMLQANHKISYAKAKSLVLNSSRKKVDIHFGYGVLDAYELVRQAKESKLP